jgi:hypothetical protein
MTDDGLISIGDIIALLQWAFGWWGGPIILFALMGAFLAVRDWMGKQ